MAFSMLKIEGRTVKPVVCEEGWGEANCIINSTCAAIIFHFLFLGSIWCPDGDGRVWPHRKLGHFNIKNSIFTQLLTQDIFLQSIHRDYRKSYIIIFQFPLYCVIYADFSLTQADVRIASGRMCMCRPLVPSA